MRPASILPLFLVLVSIACQKQTSQDGPKRIEQGTLKKYVTDEQREISRVRNQRVKSQEWKAYGFKFGNLDEKENYKGYILFDTLGRRTKRWFADVSVQTHSPHLFRELHPQIITYEYDSLGRLIRESTSDVVERISHHKYDSLGNRIETYEYSSYGSLEGKIVYQYDEYGNLTGKLRNKSLAYFLKYDRSGNLVEDDFGIYKYDDKGYMTEKTLRYDQTRVLIKYDGNGNPLEETKFNKLDEIYEMVKYTYTFYK